MSKKDKHNGHDIFCKKGVSFYSDTKEPTVNKKRTCGHCGKSRGEEGHDACLGALKGVMNACCGHGIKKDVYIQYWNGKIVQGEKALILIEKLKTEQNKTKGWDRGFDSGVWLATSLLVKMYDQPSMALEILKASGPDIKNADEHDLDILKKDPDIRDFISKAIKTGE
jgi:hypothetical protein